MANLIWLSLSVFLIFIIFLRSPQNGGLASFATKSNLLGSPNSAEKTLNKLTWSLIFGYFFLAIKFNLSI